MTWRTPCSICSSTCCRLLAIALATAVAPRVEARTWVVAATHARADDAGPGTEERPFRTIAPAALAAQPGDTILVHPGVYRQRVVPARGGEKDKPITYLSAQPGQAVIKGSDVFTPKWERVEGPEPIFRGVLDPVVEMQAHSAPLGLGFYSGTQFPEAYRGDLFVAFHGSWNRSAPTGYKVVRVPLEDGVPGAVMDFATGWLRSDGSQWGRPVDVVTSADGSLMISDDGAGRIYRVFYTGP